MGAEEVSPLSDTTKVSGPLSVDACFPGPVDVAMAFSTEPIAFGEVDELSIVKSQLVTISCIVAIQTPSHGFSMMEFDVRMFVFQLSFLTVQLHRGMAATAGKHALCDGRRRDGEFLTCPACKRDEKNP